MELQEGIDEFIEKFKRVRKERGHSQEDVSRQILVAKDHLNRVLNRRRNPGLQSFYRMMQYVYGEEVFDWLKKQLEEYEKVGKVKSG